MKYRPQEVGTDGQRRYSHRAIVERALGKPLPLGAQVHHVDGDRFNNAKANLVVCPDQAYHSLLHFRERARRETGSPNSWRCDLCSEWIVPGSLDRLGRQGCSRHKSCNRAYLKSRYSYIKKSALAESEKRA